MYREATNFLMNELDRRASGAGQQVSSTAGHLRKIADELRSDDLSRPAAQLADRGAQTLEEIGRYLEQSKGDRLLADAERLGRQRPWILATAGIALGLAGSRMLKASAARRARSDDFEGARDIGSLAGGYRSEPYRAEPYGSTPTASTSDVTRARMPDSPSTVSPVSSDAAPMTAAGQGSYTSPGAAATGTDLLGGSTISKASEAQRLTNSDGS